jgi:two-component system chemotaxis response regulator CheB
MMIVMGGSLGGMKAARTILRALPPSFPEAIALVLHRQKEADAPLLEIMQLGLTLPLDEVLDKEPLRPGHVWVAPADYHLFVEDEHLSLSTDEPVNFARPSIDVLFESAADAYGPNVIGVVLTGGNADGASGAASIVRRGGIVIVEDPATAQCPIMPQAAIQATGTSYVRPVEGIASLLVELAAKMRGGLP